MKSTYTYQIPTLLIFCLAFFGNCVLVHGAEAPQYNAVEVRIRSFVGKLYPFINKAPAKPLYMKYTTFEDFDITIRKKCATEQFPIPYIIMH